MFSTHGPTVLHCFGGYVDSVKLHTIKTTVKRAFKNVFPRKLNRSLHICRPTNYIQIVWLFSPVIMRLFLRSDQHNK